MDEDEFSQITEHSYGMAERMQGREMYESQVEHNQATTKAILTHTRLREQRMELIKAMVPMTFLLLVAGVFLPVAVYLWRWAL